MNLYGFMMNSRGNFKLIKMLWPFLNVCCQCSQSFTDLVFIAEVQSQYSGLLKLSGLSNDKLNLVVCVTREQNLLTFTRSNSGTSRQCVPTATATSVHDEVVLFNKRAKMLFKCVTAYACELHHLSHRHTAMLSCVIEDLDR